MFNSDKMLINGVDMNKKTYTCTGIFLSLGTFRRYQGPYQDFRLYSFCHSDRIKTPILLAHANVLGMKRRRAHYPVTHTQIETFTASSGAQEYTIGNAFLGQIPERIS
jgi:hypothetical protein